MNGLKKLLLTILVLLPLTVTALPVTIERDVAGLQWDTLADGDGVNIYCNGVRVGQTILPTDTDILVGEMLLTPDSPQSCFLRAYIIYTDVGMVESEDSGTLDFFTVGGIAKVSLTVEAPSAPSNFRLQY